MKRALVFLLLPSLIFALPKGKQVAHGEVKAVYEEKKLTIHQKTEKVIIDWESFSIAPGENTAFIQPSKNSAVLNRVIGKNPSEIYGTLKANGRLFLVNENGVLVGPDGVISTHHFIGSCLGIENQDFLKENYHFAGSQKGSFENQGKIEAFEHIVLLAPMISQEGTITAGGQVSLAGANDVFLYDSEGGLLVKVRGEGTVKQSGTIEAACCDLLAAGGELGQLAINQEGVIHATGFKERNGEVFLVADNGEVYAGKGEILAAGGKVHLLGDVVTLSDNLKIDVSSDSEGGEVLVGGGYQGRNPEIRNADKVVVHEDVVIDASSKENGNGGTVVLWANGSNSFYGKILAEGGEQGGDGGFVEISSPSYLDAPGYVSTFSSLGKIGTLLYDPADVTISNSANSGISAGQLPAPPPVQPDPFTVTFVGNPAAATINATALENALALNNIIIDTSLSTGGGAGNITAAASISWSAPTGLTLIADRNISINSGVTMTNSSTTTGFTAFDFRANVGGATTGSFDGIDINGSIFSGGGDIRINGTSGTTGGDGIDGNPSGIVRATAGNIFLTGTAQTSGDGIQSNLGEISTVNGNITISGTSSTGTGAQIDDAGPFRSTGNGNITIIGSSGTEIGVLIDITGDVIEAFNGDIVVMGTVDTPGSFDAGVDLRNGSFDITGTGSLFITGVVNSAAGNDVAGVVLEGFDATTAGGDINILGRVDGSLSGGYNNARGIYDTSGASMTVTGSGNITMTGIVDVSGSNNTGDNFGIETGSGTDTFSLENGNLTVSGTVLPGPGTNNIGISINDDTTITVTGSGSSIFNGTGGSGDGSTGIEITSGDTVSTTAGSLSISGTATEGNSVGVQIQGTGEILSTGTDPLTVTGIASGSEAGIEISSASGNIGGPTNTAPIVLSSDSLSLTGTVQGTNTLTVQPIGDSTAINVGDSAPSGGLQLPTTVLSQFIDGFTEIYIGKSTANNGSHTITVNNGGPLTFDDNVTFRGNTVNIVDTINSGTNTVTVNIGQTAPSSYTHDVMVTSGGFTVNGGAFNDVFNVNFVQAMTLNGGGGFNTLNGPNTSSVYSIISQNGGDVDGIFSFVNMQNITASSMADTVIFSDGIGLDGLLDGGAPADLNFMDFSNFTSPATVICLTSTSGLASNLGIGWQNFPCGNMVGNFVYGSLPSAAASTVEAQTDISFLYLNPSRDEIDRYFEMIMLGVIDKYPLNGLTWIIVNSGTVIYDRKGLLDLPPYTIKTTNIRREVQAVDYFEGRFRDSF